MILGYSSRSIIKKIEADGWYLVRVRGSHHQFKNHIKQGLVTVPDPSRDLDPKTAKSILKQAGLQ
nr:type II toxin-antitoxin system HicA family toxin [Paenibacillus massiliensis]